MRNPGWAGAALIAVALAVTACGTGSGGSAGGAYGYGNQTTQTTQATQAPAASASPSSVMTAALKTETTRAGRVLASSRGLTLYYYSEDKRGSGTSVCTGGCATAWPPLAAPVKAPAGVRLPGALGMITRPGGVKQVTINGFPVYLYAGDKTPGQDMGNGVEGSWHVIKIHSAAATTGRAAALKVDPHPGRHGAGQQPRPDAVLLHRGQAAQRQVGLHRWLRHRLAAAGRAGQGPRGRPPARPARRHHPAERRQAGHPQRLSALLLRRRQEPPARPKATA